MGEMNDVPFPLVDIWEIHHTDEQLNEARKELELLLPEPTLPLKTHLEIAHTTRMTQGRIAFRYFKHAIPMASMVGKCSTEKFEMYATQAKVLEYFMSRTYDNLKYTVMIENHN